MEQFTTAALVHQLHISQDQGKRLEVSQGQDKRLEVSQVTDKLQVLLLKVHMVDFILATELCQGISQAIEQCLEVSQATELCLEILLVQSLRLEILLALLTMWALEDSVDSETPRKIFHLILIMWALGHLQRRPTLSVQDKLQVILSAQDKFHRILRETEHSLLIPRSLLGLEIPLEILLELVQFQGRLQETEHLRLTLFNLLELELFHRISQEPDSLNLSLHKVHMEDTTQAQEPNLEVSQGQDQNLELFQATD